MSSEQRKKDSKSTKSAENKKTSNEPQDEDRSRGSRSGKLYAEDDNELKNPSLNKSTDPTTTIQVPPGAPCKKIANGFTPDQIYEPKLKKVHAHYIEPAGIPNAGPRFRQKGPPNSKVPGILVQGPLSIPQFLRADDYNKDEVDKYYPLHDYGFMVKDVTDRWSFFPVHALNDFSSEGIPQLLKDKKSYNKVKIEVLEEWFRAQKDRKHPQLFGMRYSTYTQLCCAFGLLVIVGILIAGAICAFQYFSNRPPVADSQEQSTSVALLVQHTGAPGVSAGGNVTGNATNLTSSSYTRTYPAMATLPRVSLFNWPEPTFEIVSSILELSVINIEPPMRYLPGKVVHVLDIKNETKVIHLRGVLWKITGIQLRDSNDLLIGEIVNKTYDESTQILTFNLPKPIATGIVKLDIRYLTSQEAFEITTFPCNSVTCYIAVNRQLSLLVPHFNNLLKYKWSIRVEHPSDVLVLSNNRINVSTSSNTSSIFKETSALLPTELSVVLFKNFVNHKDISLGEAYLANIAQSQDVDKIYNEMSDDRSRTFGLVREMYFFVVIPTMQNYEFIGRNVALIGDDFLKANHQIKLDFVWNWFLRQVIYQKVTSTDSNPIWIYEHTALFCSIAVHSNHKEAWLKHHYALAMDSESSGMQEVSDKSIVYEDEQRYFMKAQYAAKVHTVLAMLTSVYGAPPINVVLDDGRKPEASPQYFAINSEIHLKNNETVYADRLASCYVENPGIPRVHITRTNKSHVVIKRTGRMDQHSCDIDLWPGKRGNSNGPVYKEHILLNDEFDSVEVESDSPVLISGDSPSSAYAYTMDQAEFDRLIDGSIDLPHYGISSLSLLAYNSVRAAAEGILSIESVDGFLKEAVAMKVVTVDEVVDLWMWTLSMSRNYDQNHTEAIVASVLNTTGSPSDSANVVAYFMQRLKASIESGSSYMIEKAMELVKKCGDACYNTTIIHYEKDVACVATNKCQYNVQHLELYICFRARRTDQLDYEKYEKLYDRCAGKLCFFPILRGLVCTIDMDNAKALLNMTMHLDLNDLINRQIVAETFKGLAFNEAFKPSMLPYLMDNWHLLYERYFKYPALLGGIIDALASTVGTQEQLGQLKHFVAFHGSSLDMFREFKEQIQKAEKAVQWNTKFSREFSHHFQRD